MTSVQTARRRSTAFALAGLMLGLGSLAGCSQAGIPIGNPELASGPSPTHTRSMEATTTQAAAEVEADSVDPSDLKTVLSTAAAALNTGRTDQALAWANPVTGSSGAVTPLEAAPTGDEATCKVFASTVNDVRGIRGYRGEACQRGDGTWNLMRFVPEDAELS